MGVHVFDVAECLLTAWRHLGWRPHPRDVIMDVGCGCGDTSTKHISASYGTVVQKIVAIDELPLWIEIANKLHPHPKIEYRVADISDGSTLTKWTGTITKLFSVNHFTHLNDQAAAFKNVYDLLAPGGEALIQFCLKSNYFETYVDIFQQARWKEHLKNIHKIVPDSHTRKYDAVHYFRMLKEIGFQVVVCQAENRSYIYPSKEVGKISITNYMLVDLVPFEQREEFTQAIFDTFVRYSEGESEYPRLHYQKLLVLVRKLETSL